ncbi:MAG: hypothetical protein RBG13Loki_2140 [Promethearchaeota archaeon CR_4]|nr:MAG: hypothetical protein RBG13Loki_2140 [Candidatus Lokiarchaeota archaeon CR_4]
MHWASPHRNLLFQHYAVLEEVGKILGSRIHLELYQFLFNSPNLRDFACWMRLGLPRFVTPPNSFLRPFTNHNFSSLFRMLSRSKKSGKTRIETRKDGITSGYPPPAAGTPRGTRSVRSLSSGVIARRGRATRRGGRTRTKP